MERSTILHGKIHYFIWQFSIANCKRLPEANLLHISRKIALFSDELAENYCLSFLIIGEFCNVKSIEIR